MTILGEMTLDVSVLTCWHWGSGVKAAAIMLGDEDLRAAHRAASQVERMRRR